MNRDTLSLDRRSFLKAGATAGLGVALAGGVTGALASTAGASAIKGPKHGGTLRYAAAGGGVASPDPATASRTLPLAIAANC